MNEITTMAGGLFGIVLIIFVIVMMILLFLMPLYIALIYGELRRISRATEKSLTLAKQQTTNDAEEYEIPSV